jgi:energy-coupling factor transporter ATP-binding protein EcfA2
MRDLCAELGIVRAGGPHAPHRQGGSLDRPITAQALHISSMRTLLGQFCEAFDDVVRPLLEPLAGASDALGSSKDPSRTRNVRAELMDLKHELEILADKVAEQQAYVLLFGPLKSGKSTLMNALAGAYVSEVSSLPAYPCMVYLSHAAERVFYVTRYDGRTERFTDPSALYVHVSRAHGELAERIRAAEERGEAFDPSLHFPEAIRKVDVRIPAGELEESGAVLVDTPGLYSRMKFGYDRMTREFRNAASCAIFIVKSDNLFLEQVFEEFEDLLDLFSRIFLVVNLDTSKRDLSPDGTLVPSLEQEDPLRIIDAFENLAMSAPLKEAAEQGRLRIYPVDILRAASHRLGGAERDETPARGQANFDAFLRDLTEYLNSTDYLVAFLGDSLRRAHTLLQELSGALDHDEIEKLRARADELDAKRQDVQRRRGAAQRLVAFDWRASFAELDEKLAPTIRERSRAVSAQTERDLDQVIERWFGTDSSFDTLVEDELVPRLARYQEELASFVHQTLEDEVQPGTAGLLLPTDVASDLYAAGLDMTQVGQSSLAALDRAASQAKIPRPLVIDQVPVKRTLVDWLLFRSVATVRKKLFGDLMTPSARIPVEQKHARLGAEAKEAMRRELDLFKGRFFHATVQRVHQHLIGRYADAAVDRMRRLATERESLLGDELDASVAALMEHRRLLAHLASLRTLSLRARAGVDELQERYAKTKPNELIELAPDGTIPTPAMDSAALELREVELAPIARGEDRPSLPGHVRDEAFAD